MFVPLISIEDLLYSVEISGSYSQFVISGGFGWVIQLYIDQWRYYLSWSNNGSNHCCRTDLTTTDSNFKMTATPSLDVLSPRHDDQKVDLAFVIDCTQLMIHTSGGLRGGFLPSLRKFLAQFPTFAWRWLNTEIIYPKIDHLWPRSTILQVCLRWWKVREYFCGLKLN